MTVHVSIRAGFIPVRITASGGGGDGADPADAAYADHHNGHRIFRLKQGVLLPPNDSIEADLSLEEALTLEIVEEPQPAAEEEPAPT